MTFKTHTANCVSAFTRRCTLMEKKTKSFFLKQGGKKPHGSVWSHVQVNGTEAQTALDF